MCLQADPASRQKLRLALCSWQVQTAASCQARACTRTEGRLWGAKGECEMGEADLALNRNHIASLDIN